MNKWLLLLLLATSVAANHTGPGLGEGAPAFQQYDAPADLPNAGNSGEPTIGIPWGTNAVYYQAYASTYRITFNNNTAEWEDVTPANQLPVNLDPMLHADPVTGRVWAGGLYTACSVMMFSDDGDNWSPTVNMCGLYGIDHQTIGSGPWSDFPVSSPVYERAVYYCAHGEALSSPALNPALSIVSPTACATSFDGGQTWGAPIPWVGGCGSLHGHVRVSEVTGFAAVPDADCATAPGATSKLAGFAYSDNNGATWLSRTVAGSVAYSPFDNPSLAFGHDEGWLWYGQGGDDGAFIALSKDEGVSWETFGDDNGTTWLNVGQFHDPPIVEATLPDVMVGDDDRVALSFIGLEDLDGDGKADEYVDNNECGDITDNRVWYYYVALSYDAGTTWDVVKVSDDPVQIGGVFQGQGDPCRNLLDFNDMDIDSEGRLYIGFADGCIADCASSGGENGFRTQYASLLRQNSGRSLFSAYDVPMDTDGDGILDADDDDIDGDGILNDDDEFPNEKPNPESIENKGSPLFALPLLGLALLALARRK